MTNSDFVVFDFIRDLKDGSIYKLGTAVQYAAGWRFISNVSSHRSSRRFHATMKGCIPRWIGKHRMVAIR